MAAQRKLSWVGEKNMSGGYGDLTALIPCEKTVTNSCKLEDKLKQNYNFPRGSKPSNTK